MKTLNIDLKRKLWWETFEDGSLTDCEIPVRGRLESGQNIEKLARLKGCNSVRDCYYPCTGGLSIGYIYKDVKLVFNCTDRENALQKISHGKCKFIERPYTETDIECSLENKTNQ